MDKEEIKIYVWCSYVVRVRKQARALHVRTYKRLGVCSMVSVVYA